MSYIILWAFQIIVQGKFLVKKEYQQCMIPLITNYKVAQIMFHNFQYVLLYF